MIKLLKGLECYCPEYIGRKDILIIKDKIYKIESSINLTDDSLIEEIIPCDGLLAFPGIIDQHVHIIGGGGEDGFSSRISEIDVDEIIFAGITTVIGLLGADNQTKGLSNLIAKARSLEALGINTYAYTGSYSIPPITLTGNITSDLVFIDKFIGIGEVALSDHRSSHPELRDMLKLATETHLGGLLGKKAGIVHIHLGDGKFGLDLLFKLIKKSDLPIEMFVPTHMNRNKDLFKQAISYCKLGGFIDLTAGEIVGIDVPSALLNLLDNGVDLNKITVSSDAKGAFSKDKIGSSQNLYNDIIKCIVIKNIKPETAFKFVTENVARILKLYPNKGIIHEGSDADILITDNNYKIKKLICMGKFLINEKI
ncbi:MAG: beta-aspartyl-peptidase [Clostridia bacterium]|nr:beta-aspartyl-peptidase [Clostridia bacterium]